jgi:hypothetical protein
MMAEMLENKGFKAFFVASKQQYQDSGYSNSCLVETSLLPEINSRNIDVK